MVPPNWAASTTPRLNLRPTAQGGLVESVNDRHGRRPPSPSQRSRPSRQRRSKHALHRAVRPPQGPCAVRQSASAPKGQLFGLRAGGAGSVCPISHREKRTATPMTARGVPKLNRSGDALARSPMSPQLWPPSTRRRHLRRPSVLGDAARCLRATIPVRGVTSYRARARTVVPTTRGWTGRVRRRPARASPLPLLNRSDRGGCAAPSTHCCEPSDPLRGGALATNQRPHKRDGSLPQVPAVPVPSARSWVGGSGRPARASPLLLLKEVDRGGCAVPSTHRCEPSHHLRGEAAHSRRCRPVARMNPIASTTPLIGRSQRLSRRCRRRAVIAVGVEVPDGS